MKNSNDNTATEQKLTAVGCHVFAGAYSIGIRQAGYDVLCHLEDGDFGAETSRKNLGMDVYTDAASWPVEKLRGKVDLLYGNPPCAIFSAAGYKKGKGRHHHTADPRSKMIGSLVEAGIEMKAKVITWESVTNAWRHGRDTVIADVEQLCQANGYKVYHLLIDGQFCGLPQKRLRYFFVASKVEMDFSRPAIRPLTVREALASLPEGYKSTGKEATLPWRVVMSQMEDGKTYNISKHYKKFYQQMDMFHPIPEGVKFPRFGFLYYKLGYDEVAPTVLGNVLLHPEGKHWLDQQEQKALMGIPFDYAFTGKSASQQPTKCVAPPVARWLGGQIAEGLRRAEPILLEEAATLDFIKEEEDANPKPRKRK